MSDARWRFTTLAHAGRALLGPVSDASVDAMLASVPPSRDARVLDVGCGKGELLVRALERLGGTGVGIDPNPTFAEDARARAERRLGTGRVRIEPRAFDAAAHGGERYSLVICTGALHAFGDWTATLRGVAALVLAGGYALLGPTYWKRPPADGYLAHLGTRTDEMHTLPQTLAIAVACGWRQVNVHESTLDEWDDYEGAYATRMREWCAAHPGDPDAASFRDRIERWADAYRRWGRDTLGFALTLFQQREGISA